MAEAEVLGLSGDVVRGREVGMARGGEAVEASML